MSNVRIEDCLKAEPNKFKLILSASERAKTLVNGSSPLYVPDKKEKNTIIALNEIANGLLDVKEMETIVENNIKNQIKISDDKEIATDQIEIINTTKDRVIVDVEMAEDGDELDEDLEDDDDLKDDELDDLDDKFDK
jgi:DNA-directed RNA polymerase subunit omega